MSEELGIRQLQPDIYQFQGKKPECHAYLVRGSRKNALIDTGMPGRGGHLERCLGEIGLALRDVNLVILTHEHIDHVGAAPYFFDTTIIAAHGLAAAKLELQDEFVLMNLAFDLPADGFQVDLLFEGDCTIDLGGCRLRILPTPGHSSGTVCVYQPERRVLFAGDTIMAGGGGGVFESGNISDYIHSIERLQSLQIDALYPGHGPISFDPRADFATAIEKSRALLQDAKALFRALGSRKDYEHMFRYARDLNK